MIVNYPSSSYRNAKSFDLCQSCAKHTDAMSTTRGGTVRVHGKDARHLPNAECANCGSEHSKVYYRATVEYDEVEA